MAQKVLICLLLLLPLLSWGQTVDIGNGDLLNQGLPFEPLARFSYSQQLYLADEIGQSGTITHLGFQYHVQSTGFLDANKNLKIYMGHSELSSLNNWVSMQDMSEVFDGMLSLSDFDSGLPGSGWLLVTLQTPFNYDAQSNLLVAVDENSELQGNSSDDFFCIDSGSQRALQFQSLSVNPDPANPPENPNLKSSLSNLRLVFSGSVDAPYNLHGYYEDGAISLNWDVPELDDIAAYRINRNGLFLAESPVDSYQDSSVNHGETYSYNVQIRFQDGSISGPSNSIQISVPPEGFQQLIAQGFDALPGFSTDIPQWQNLDLDQSPTWEWDHTDFPQEGEAMGWMVFSPSACQPPITDPGAHSGANMLMAIACVNPPNNDWLISPWLHLGTNASFSFWGRSYTSAYGLERMRVLISTADGNPESFKTLHGENYLTVPASWTEYSFDLSEYQDQDVWLAINCVSLDAMALFVDDISLYCEGGYLDTDEEIHCPQLVKNYPNPARSSFKLDSDLVFSARIYNLRGQLLHKVHNIKQFDSADLQLPSGIYLIRIEEKERAYILKQVILP